MMRQMAVVLNLIVAVFFTGFLAYTFLARLHLETLARDFVTEQTLSYSKPIVEVADESLDSPLVKKVLSEDKANAVRSEIADYRNDPSAYIADLTRQHERDVSSLIANPLRDKVASIKDKIRTFYDSTLNALITDLRIFASSNLIAGMIALALAYQSSPQIRMPVVWFSLLMFAAVLYCSYLYIDDLTFFRILFRTHMGWWYAGMLCVMIITLYLDYGRGRNATGQGDASERETTLVVEPTSRTPAT